MTTKSSSALRLFNLSRRLAPSLSQPWATSPPLDSLQEAINFHLTCNNSNQVVLKLMPSVLQDDLSSLQASCSGNAATPSTPALLGWEKKISASSSLRLHSSLVFNPSFRSLETPPTGALPVRWLAYRRSWPNRYVWSASPPIRAETNFYRRRLPSRPKSRPFSNSNTSSSNSKSPPAPSCPHSLSLLSSDAATLALTDAFKANKYPLALDSLAINPWVALVWAVVLAWVSKGKGKTDTLVDTA